MNTRPRASLAELRETAGLTQQEAAEAVNHHIGQPGGGPVTAGQVSRWERGQQRPQVRYQRALAALYQVPIGDLPLGKPQPATSTLTSILQEPAITAVDPRVTRSREEWVTTRRHLNAHRRDLTRIAADLYPVATRLGDTGLLTAPGWLPPEPVPLDKVTLTAEDPTFRGAITGTEPQTGHVRPCVDLANQYARYTAAVRDLDPPRLFDNRYSWQLTTPAWASREGRLRFTDTTYFAGMDVCEALAHEMAHLHLDHAGQPVDRVATLRELPFRRLLADPFDPTRRTTLTSISTLLIRGGPDPTFLLHRRDSRNVAVAGGMLHVIPSGIFQPSSVLPGAVAADFSLWRNLMRELAEELLGVVEANGDDQPVDYTAPPFNALDAAYTDGQITVHALGVGLDALTLASEILTVAVVDPGMFDLLAADFVTTNDEGTVIGEQLPFDEPTVIGVLGSGRMAPAGAGCLQLAWQHREQLLSGLVAA